MIVPLIPIKVPSIYFKNGQRVFLPSQLALCSPDTQNAVIQVEKAVHDLGGDFFLSDMFRTHDMQLQAALDFESHKKKAFSPRPVGSMHEAGRAIDLDLGRLIKKVPLKDFRDLAAKFGMVPILDDPTEAHHFDCRGSHDIVFEYYRARKATNISSPYKAMAISGVLTAGIFVDDFKERQKEAVIQSGLIRLGFDIGNMDGFIGPKTRKGLEDAGISPTETLDNIMEAMRILLEAKFPQEYFQQVIQTETDEFVVPVS